jgi:hypothetical protein
MAIISQVLGDAEPVGEAEAKPKPEADPQLAAFVPILQQRQANPRVKSLTFIILNQGTNKVFYLH